MRRITRSPLLAGLAAGAVGLSALGLAGCGSSGPPVGPAVTVTLSAPADGSRTSSGQARVSGRVVPASARVQVVGRAARVSATGTFSASVGLSLGSNLIDVIASAPRSAGAVTAIRVIRFALVTMPSVVGEKPGAATSALKALGLHVQRIGSEDPLNALIPGSNTVCSSIPSAGAKLDPGSLVVIKTSKLCF